MEVHINYQYQSSRGVNPAPTTTTTGCASGRAKELRLVQAEKMIPEYTAAMRRANELSGNISNITILGYVEEELRRTLANP